MILIEIDLKVAVEVLAIVFVDVGVDVGELFVWQVFVELTTDRHLWDTTAAFSRVCESNLERIIWEISMGMSLIKSTSLLYTPKKVISFRKRSIVKFALGNLLFREKKQN